MNAILAAAGHNLRIILRKLRLFWPDIIRQLLKELSPRAYSALAA